MAGNERIFSLRQFSFDDVEVRPADATRANSKQKLAGCELRLGSLFDLKRLLRGSEYGCFQGLWFRGCETALDCDYASQDTPPTPEQRPDAEHNAARAQNSLDSRHRWLDSITFKPTRV